MFARWLSSTSITSDSLRTDTADDAEMLHFSAQPGDVIIVGMGLLMDCMMVVTAALGLLRLITASLASL